MLTDDTAGVNVYHAHAVSIDDSTLAAGNNKLSVKDLQTSQTTTLVSKLVVDATGRFRRFASKHARLKRYEGVLILITSTSFVPF